MRTKIKAIGKRAPFPFIYSKLPNKGERKQEKIINNVDEHEVSIDGMIGIGDK